MRVSAAGSLSNYYKLITAVTGYKCFVKVVGTGTLKGIRRTLLYKHAQKKPQTLEGSAV
jgi:hypothetical protein